MAYTISYAGPDGANTFTVADGTLNINKTPLSLPGRNYAGYGQPVNQDLVDLTQNFARLDGNTIANASPLRGQLWFDTSTPGANANANVTGSLSALKVNYSNGTTPNWQVLVMNNSSPTFTNVTTNYITSGSNSTVGTLVGNWTVSTGSQFNLAAGTNANFFSSSVITRDLTTTDPLIDGNIIGTWTLSDQSSITLGGLLSYIDATAGNLITNTLKAGGTGPNAGIGDITGRWQVDNGSTFQIGNVAGGPGGNLILLRNSGSTVDLRVGTGDNFYANSINAGSNTALANLTGNWIVTQGSNLTLSGAVANFLNGNLFSNTLFAGGSYGNPNNQAVGSLVGNWVLSMGSVIDTRLGASLYANNISTGSTSTIGNLTGNWSINNDLTVKGFAVVNGNVTLGANSTSTNTTVVGILTNQNITTGATGTQGNITGNWQLSPGSRLIATYADLGERFHADGVYDAGTVVELGGQYEITLAKQELSDSVFGVISESAGYIMNGGAGNDKTHPVIAMSGRVPVKVKGQVKKGQRLVAAGDGVARAAKDNEATERTTIGRALEDKDTLEVATVLSAVSAKI